MGEVHSEAELLTVGAAIVQRITLNRIVAGKISIHPRGFGFVEFESDGKAQLAFVTPPDLNPFLLGDEVRAELESAAPDRWNAKRLELVNRTRVQLFGSVVLRGGRAFLHADRQLTNTDWPIVGSLPGGLHETASESPPSGSGRSRAGADRSDRSAPAPEAGRLLVVRVEGDHVVPERWVDDADSSLERLRVRYQIRTEWPASCEQELRNLRPLQWDGRRDLRDMPTLTIDSSSSKDLDDALGVLPAGPDGCVRVFVSIADVDAYVPENSALDREARERATTVYLAGGITPMLPAQLSEELGSLLPGKERPTLTVELRIDPEGEVRSVDIYESVIRSTTRLDYREVAHYLELGDAGHIAEEILPTLRWLRTAASRLAALRAARGGVTLLRSEACVTIDELTRKITGIVERDENEAHLLIERLMVAANEAVARWLVDRGLPGVFRVHDAPAKDAVSELESSARNFGFEPGFGPALSPRSLSAFEAQFSASRVAPAVRSVVSSILGPARYTMVPGPHFGLGAPLYLHFTSPIRRYADLAVHRIVKRFLRGDRAQLAGTPELESLCESINELSRNAAKAEEERLRMIAARHFSTRIGERFQGNIITAKPFGLIVQLADMGITGTIQIENLPGGELRHVGHGFVGEHRSYCVGDRLEVQVAGTDEVLGRIDLVLVDSPKAPPVKLPINPAPAVPTPAPRAPASRAPAAASRIATPSVPEKAPESRGTPSRRRPTT